MSKNFSAGFYVAHRETRWDPYPHLTSEDYVLVYVEHVTHEIVRITDANGIYEYRMGMILIAEASGCLRENPFNETTT